MRKAGKNNHKKYDWFYCSGPAAYIKALIAGKGVDFKKIEQNVANWGQDIDQNVYHGRQTDVAHGQQNIEHNIPHGGQILPANARQVSAL